MQPFLQNKYVRFVGIIAIALITLFIILMFLGAMSGSSRNTGLSMGMPTEFGYGGGMMDAVAPAAYERMDSGVAMQNMMDTDAYYPTPVPTPSGYTSNLEQYETTIYGISGQTRQFDELCNTLAALKADPDIHFKSINASTNNCYMNFYVAEVKVAGVLSTIEQFNGVEVNRNTTSVTRYKQNIQSQTNIIEQQLANVERALASAETEFDEITAFARTQNNAKAFSDSIREKLNLIDSLTQRKISLTSQLRQLYQQATDLDERIGVVEFSVSVTRLHPVYPNRWSKEWSTAWENLKTQANETLIGLTLTFGIFLLWMVRIALYLIVLIVLVRGLWKIGRMVWSN